MFTILYQILNMCSKKYIPLERKSAAFMHATNFLTKEAQLYIDVS